MEGFDGIIFLFEILEDWVWVLRLADKFYGLIFMDFADGAIAFVGSRDVHGHFLIFIPNGAFLDRDVCQLFAGIAFGLIWITSIIEDVELVSIEVASQLGDEELVFGRFFLGTDEVVTSDVHVLFLCGEDECGGGVVVELINGVFFRLCGSFDDHEGRVDVVDGQDVAVHESVLQEVADVLVFLVLLYRTGPLGQQFLHRKWPTFKSCCSFMRLGSSYRERLSTIQTQKFQYELYQNYSFALISIFMMICKIVAPVLTALRLRSFMAYYKPHGKNKVKVFERRIDSAPQESIRKIKSMQVYENQSEIELAESIKSLNLKDFSIKIHHLMVGKQKSPLFWSTVENQFMNRLVPTTDPVQIRSYSKVLYSLSKSKKATGNYETKISLILPFATPQSFTTMITAMSRIAPYSQQFGYIVEMMYYKRKSELNPREIIAVNYSLANNGRLCDKGIIECIESLNAVETITMLRSYDKSEQMTKQILAKTLIKIQAIKRELNALDIADIICIYLKHEYIPSSLQTMLQESYTILKRHINDICIEKIWTHLPKSVNKGYLKIKFVEEIITTIQILRKGKNMSEVIWKKMQPTFQEIENIELKLRLEKIY